MNIKENIYKSDANLTLIKLFNRIVVASNFEETKFNEAAKEFAKISFNSFYKEQPFPENSSSPSGIMHFIIPQYKWVIHDSELKLWDGFLNSLIPISGALFAGGSIPVLAVTLATTFFLQKILPVIKKGTKLSDKQMEVLLSLKLLSKENNNKVNISKLVNEKNIKTLEKKDVIKILKSLQNIIHKDGTTSKFVDTLDQKEWWTVDV